jgi:hypothetical protein
MRLLNISILTVLALVAAACGGGSADQSTTTVGDSTTTTAKAPAETLAGVPAEAATPDALLLSYALEPGTTFEYEVGIDQQIELSATGDASAMGDEEFPGNASINLVGTTTFSQSVAEGPEPDTYEITIKGDFTDLQIRGTIDGEPIDQTDLPDFAELEAIDVTVVVDEQGNIIPDDDMFGDALGGDLGGFGDLAAPGMDLGRFVGPPLAEGPVGVGDTWSETIESPVFMGIDPIVTQIDNEVTDTATIDGYEVFVIKTTSTTSMIEFDLAEFLVGFFQGFIPDDATDEEKAEIEAIAEELRFLFVIDETVSEMTTWFDPEAGYARQAGLSMGTSIVMDINMPDDVTGEMATFGMEMDIAQEVTYRLIGASN